MFWLFMFFAGVFWGLASLTRSVTYPLTPIIGLFLFFVLPDKKKALLGAFLFVLGVVFTLSPWVFRNYQVFGHFVAVDTMGGLNLYMGNYEYTPLHRAWAAVANPPEIAWYRGYEDELRGLNEAEKQRWAIAKALSFMREHPGLTGIRVFIKAANFWQLERSIIAGVKKGLFPGLSNRFLGIFVALSILTAYVLVVILGIAGLMWSLLEARSSVGLRSKSPGAQERAFHWLALLIIAYFTAIHALVFGHSRYHLPLMALLSLYAAYLGVNWGYLWRNCRLRLGAILIPVVFGFSLIWIYDIFVGSKDKVEAFLKIIFKGP